MPINYFGSKEASNDKSERKLDKLEQEFENVDEPSKPCFEVVATGIYQVNEFVVIGGGNNTIEIEQKSFLAEERKKLELMIHKKVEDLDWKLHFGELDGQIWDVCREIVLLNRKLRLNLAKQHYWSDYVRVGDASLEEAVCDIVSIKQENDVPVSKEEVFSVLCNAVGR